MLHALRSNVSEVRYCSVDVQIGNTVWKCFVCIDVFMMACMFFYRVSREGGGAWVAAICSLKAGNTHLFLFFPFSKGVAQ
jgi:hypothetical protein